MMDGMFSEVMIDNGKLPWVFDLTIHIYQYGWNREDQAVRWRGHRQTSRPQVKWYRCKKVGILKSDGWKISDCGVRYLMCVAAASVAEATTYPLDLCKTRWNHPCKLKVSLKIFVIVLDNQPTTFLTGSRFRGSCLVTKEAEKLTEGWSAPCLELSERRFLKIKIIKFMIFFLFSGVVPVVERHVAGSLQTCNIYR